MIYFFLTPKIQAIKKTCYDYIQNMCCTLPWLHLHCHPVPLYYIYSLLVTYPLCFHSWSPFFTHNVMYVNTHQVNHCSAQNPPMPSYCTWNRIQSLPQSSGSCVIWSLHTYLTLTTHLLCSRHDVCFVFLDLNIPVLLLFRYCVNCLQHIIPNSFLWLKLLPIQVPTPVSHAQVRPFLMCTLISQPLLSTHESLPHHHLFDHLLCSMSHLNTRVIYFLLFTIVSPQRICDRGTEPCSLFYYYISITQHMAHSMCSKLCFE